MATGPVGWQRGLWCGNGPCGVATGPVVWQRALWCGNGPCGVATGPVVWQRGLWCGNVACGVAGPFFSFLFYLLRVMKRREDEKMSILSMIFFDNIICVEIINNYT